MSNSTTQDVTQLGGLWSRRPISGLSFIIGTAGLIALPPLGSFWALLELVDGLWSSQPWLLGVVLMVNGVSAFSLTRVFSLIFGGKPKQMAQRSPEVHWLMVLPMMVLLGFVIHLPLILQSFALLPSWADLSKDVALLLLWSSLTGIGIGAVVYLSNAVAKPVRFPLHGLQDLLAHDFYTAKLYRLSIVFSVGLVSRLAYWFDRYIVDGIVNLFGIVTIFGGQTLKYSTSGQVQSYVVTIVLGALCIGCLMLWSPQM